MLRQKMEAGIPPTSAYNRGDKHNKNKQNKRGINTINKENSK